MAAGADHPDRLGRPGRGAGEPAGPRSPVAGALPLEAAAAAGDRGHQVRHGREHRRHRAARASAPTSRCRRSVSRPGCSARPTSSTTRRPIPTAVPGARRCASSPSARRPGGASTRPQPGPAPPARSGRSARRRSAAGAWGAACEEAYLDRVRGYHDDRALRQGDAQTARSGWSRCSPKPRTGTGCAASACGGWRRSTARRC